MRGHTRSRTFGLTGAVILLGAWMLIQAGPLEPPVPPGNPTMKPIDQLEPRIPIYAGDLPLTIDQRGSYYLAEDIVTTGGGITVQVAFVTIDLMGFTLEGGTGPGIDGYFAAGLTVRNGTIYGWSGTGVRAGQAAELQNLIVWGNGGSGIDVEFDSRVVGCTADNNTVHGIIVDAASLVKDSIATDNGENGIWVKASIHGGALVTDSVADNNQRNGIRTDGYASILDNHIRSNDLVGSNGKAGIWVNGPYNRIEGNTLLDNNIGIDVDGDHNVVVRNTAGDNLVRNFDEDAGATGNYMPVWAVGGSAPPDPWANIEQP